MIRVITIEREYGSGGGEIARLLAGRKGFKLWDQLLTGEIARRMHCQSGEVQEREERRDPLYYRLFKSFLRGSFEGSLEATGLPPVDAESIRVAVEELMPQIAEEGDAVIVGRGSAYYLRGRGDVFHAFVYAPFEDKVRRLQAAGKSEEDAVELVETVDRERAVFIKHQFHVDWPAREYFNVMLNSALGIETSVEIILDAVAEVEKAL